MNNIMTFLVFYITLLPISSFLISVPFKTVSVLLVGARLNWRLACQFSSVNHSSYENEMAVPVSYTHLTLPTILRV